MVSRRLLHPPQPPATLKSRKPRQDLHRHLALPVRASPSSGTTAVPTTRLVGLTAGLSGTASVPLARAAPLIPVQLAAPPAVGAQSTGVLEAEVAPVLEAFPLLEPESLVAEVRCYAEAGGPGVFKDGGRAGGGCFSVGRCFEGWRTLGYIREEYRQDGGDRAEASHDTHLKVMLMNTHSNSR